MQANRKAAHVSFSAEAGQDTRPALTIGALTDKFQPTTDLEKEMDTLFHALKQQDVGVAADGMVEDEGLTKEEFDKRQGEMAKIRALMSYHEKVLTQASACSFVLLTYLRTYFMTNLPTYTPDCIALFTWCSLLTTASLQKVRHMNKIKSKSYRKIRKKQKLKQEEAERERLRKENPSAAAKLDEADMLARAKERMTLKHRNKSKWAKRVLKMGGTSNETHREALNRHVQRSQELMTKMHKVDDGASDSDGSSDGSGSGSGSDTGSDSDGSDSDDGKAMKGSSLLKRLMARGGDSGSKPLLALDGLGNDSDSADDSDGDMDVADKTREAAAGSSGKSGNTHSNSNSNNSANAEKLKGGKPARITAAMASTTGVVSVDLAPSSSAAVQVQSSKKASTAPSLPSAASAAAAAGSVAVPAPTSLPASAAFAVGKTTKAAGGKAAISAAAKAAAAAAAAFAPAAQPDAGEASDAVRREEVSEPVARKRAQEELVRRAFAGYGAVEADFEREKEALEEAKKPKEIVPSDGWGSWAGLVSVLHTCACPSTP